MNYFNYLDSYIVIMASAGFAIVFTVCLRAASLGQPAILKTRGVLVFLALIAVPTMLEAIIRQDHWFYLLFVPSYIALSLKAHKGSFFLYGLSRKDYALLRDQAELEISGGEWISFVAGKDGYGRDGAIRHQLQKLNLSGNRFQTLSFAAFSLLVAVFLIRSIF